MLPDVRALAASAAVILDGVDGFAAAFAGAHRSAESPWSGLPPPTKAQRKANAYLTGPVAWQGFALRIENPAGTAREGEDDSGRSWRNVMAAHYGFIESTRGADGDEIDLFLGPSPESSRVWVINQRHARGGFDEHKVLAGFHDRRAAIDAYRLSYEPGWDRFGEPVPLSLDQLRWWLRFGDHERELTPDLVPPESDMEATPQMPRVYWDSAAMPQCRMSLGDVLYAIRLTDVDDGLLFDAVTLADVVEGCEVVRLDALVVVAGRLKPKLDAMLRIMEAAADTVKPLAVQISEPVRRFGGVHVAAIYELSDGQTITVWFHNPDSTPTKITPADELVSWKWQLNKKDITIVVAPENGQDLNMREVARRIMRLAEKNSAAFAKANEKRAATMAEVAGLKSTLVEKQGVLATLNRQIEVARVEVESRPPKSAVPAVVVPDVPDEPIEPTDADKAAAVQAAYAFESATPDFLAWLWDSLSEPEYSPFATAKAMDEAAKAGGAGVQWALFTGQATMDAVDEDAKKAEAAAMEVLRTDAVWREEEHPRNRSGEFIRGAVEATAAVSKGDGDAAYKAAMDASTSAGRASPGEDDFVEKHDAAKLANEVVIAAYKQKKIKLSAAQVRDLKLNISDHDGMMKARAKRALDAVPTDDDAVPTAKALLRAAIELHRKHMNGTAPTTGAEGEESQQKMMDMMQQALEALGSKRAMKMDATEVALDTLKNNEPINRAEGNTEQADLELSAAASFRHAIALLKADEAGRAGAVLLDSADGTDYVGKVVKGGVVLGRIDIAGGDGKAMVYVGESGSERVKTKSGNPYFYSEDDAAEMVEDLLAMNATPVAQVEEAKPDPAADTTPPELVIEPVAEVAAPAEVLVEGEALTQLAAKVAEAMRQHQAAYVEQRTHEPENFRASVMQVLGSSASGTVYKVVDVPGFADMVATILIPQQPASPAPGPKPTPNAARIGDIAFLTEVAEGKHPEMLEPELADRIERVLTAYPDDAEIQALGERAIVAYSNGLMAVTS